MRSPGIVNLQNGLKTDTMSIESYPGDTLRFDLVFEDSLLPTQTVGDSITLNPSIDPVLFPGATWQLQNGNPATFTFEWPVLYQNRRSKFGTIEIIDDACVMAGFNGYTFQIKVVVPEIEIPDDTLCINENAILLSTKDSNLTGSFFGVGITGNSFDPGVAGPGTHKLGYAFNGIDTVNFEITVVQESAHIDFSFPDTLCTTDSLYDFHDATPAGGTFSGSGIIAGAFDPLFAGAGNHTVTYRVVDQVLCPLEVSKTVVVFSGPEISMEAGSVCIGDTLAMTATATNADSLVWTSGHRGSSALVWPEKSTYYWVTAYGAGGCSASATTLVLVHDLPADFLPADTSICTHENVTLKPVRRFETYQWSTGTADSTLLFNGSQNAPGVFTFTLDVVDEFGCKGKDTVVVTLEDCNTSTGGVFGSDQNMKVYPNPSSGVFVVEFEALRSEPAQIKLLDLNGRVVHVEQTGVTNGLNQIQLNVQNLAAGNYLLQIEVTGEVSTMKLKLKR